MAQKLLVANWKSNKTKSEVISWLEAFSQKKESILSAHQLEVILAPPFVFIDLIADFISKNDKIMSLATQDLSSFPAGSYTGAISSLNLSDWPVRYTIVGHSERRRWFHETDNDIALKVEQALVNKLIPIVCVDDQTLSSQAGKLDSKAWSQTIIAYEPKGAVGTGLAQDIDEVRLATKRIKQEYAENAPVLYGGSVNELNINDYLSITDGVLVGSASLEADRFMSLIQATNEPPHLS